MTIFVIASIENIEDKEDEWDRETIDCIIGVASDLAKANSTANWLQKNYRESKYPGYENVKVFEVPYYQSDKEIDRERKSALAMIGR